MIRGELQYKEVKLPAEKILENLGDARLPRSLQVAYVATDERNKTFFDAFRRRFKTVRIADLVAISKHVWITVLSSLGCSILSHSIPGPVS
jgi:hypothetical protein